MEINNERKRIANNLSLLAQDRLRNKYVGFNRQKVSLKSNSLKRTSILKTRLGNANKL